LSGCLEFSELRFELLVLRFERRAPFGVGARSCPVRLDLVVRKRLPDGSIFTRLCGALLGGETHRKLGIGGFSRLLASTLCGLELRIARRNVIPQPLELTVERRIRSLRLRRRHERPRIELLVVPKRPLKPNPELPRHPKLMQRLTVVPLPLVHRRVPH